MRAGFSSTEISQKKIYVSSRKNIWRRNCGKKNNGPASLGIGWGSALCPAEACHAWMPGPGVPGSLMGLWKGPAASPTVRSWARPARRGEGWRAGAKRGRVGLIWRNSGGFVWNAPRCPVRVGGHPVPYHVRAVAAARHYHILAAEYHSPPCPPAPNMLRTFRCAHLALVGEFLFSLFVLLPNAKVHEMFRSAREGEPNSWRGGRGNLKITGETKWGFSSMVYALGIGKRHLASELYFAPLGSLSPVQGKRKKKAGGWRGAGVGGAVVEVAHHADQVPHLDWLIARRSRRRRHFGVGSSVPGDRGPVVGGGG